MTIRPIGLLGSLFYALRAAILHYRFARTPHRADTFGGVVTFGAPTQDEMDTVGSRWSDLSRMQGMQPLDPAVSWSDMRIMWRAYHDARSKMAYWNTPENVVHVAEKVSLLREVEWERVRDTVNYAERLPELGNRERTIRELRQALPVLRSLATEYVERRTPAGRAGSDAE